MTITVDWCKESDQIKKTSEFEVWSESFLSEGTLNPWTEPFVPGYVPLDIKLLFPWQWAIWGAYFYSTGSCCQYAAKAVFSSHGLTHYLTETPFNAFANQAGLDLAALLRAAWSESTHFANGNMIYLRYDVIIIHPTLVDLTSNFFVLYYWTNMNVYLYNHSYWVDPSINIHEGKG